MSTFNRYQWELYAEGKGKETIDAPGFSGWRMEGIYCICSGIDDSFLPG